MTYAFVTEWMTPEAAEKFDREIGEEPGVTARRQSLEANRTLMNVFSMATV